MRDHFNVESSHGFVLLRGDVRGSVREVEVVEAWAYDEDLGAWVQLDSHPKAKSLPWAEDAYGALEAQYREDRESAAIDNAFDAARDRRLEAWLDRHYGPSPASKEGL